MRFSLVHPAIFALALIGCAVAPAATPAPASKAAAKAPAVPLVRLHGNPGETMEFAVTLRGITIGRVQSAVGHKEEWIVFNAKHDHDEYPRTWSDETHDPHSAAGVLRGWRSQPGDRGTLTMWFSGGSTVVVVDAGRVVFPAGNRPAVVYEGTTEDDHRFTVWISDDAARVPLRMSASTKFGVVNAELVHYDAPRDST